MSCCPSSPPVIELPCAFKGATWDGLTWRIDSTDGTDGSDSSDADGTDGDEVLDLGREDRPHVDVGDVAAIGLGGAEEVGHRRTSEVDGDDAAVASPQ